MSTSWRQALLKDKHANCLNSLAVKFLLFPKSLSSFPEGFGFWKRWQAFGEEGMADNQDVQGASSPWLTLTEESQINVMSPANCPYRTGFLLDRVLPWPQQHRWTLYERQQPLTHTPPSQLLPLLLSCFLALCSRPCLSFSLWFPFGACAASSELHGPLSYLSSFNLFDVFFPVNSSFPFFSRIFLV